MEYEEAIINGVLCYRDTQDSEWVQKTPEQLTETILMLLEMLDDQDGCNDSCSGHCGCDCRK